MPATTIIGKRAIRIFLSSTSRDLKNHRDVLRNTLREPYYELITMEKFGARDGDAVTVSLERVSPCDIFIGIYAHRYGYVPEGYTKSVTHLEYDEAKRLGKPRLIFKVKEDGSEYHLLEEHRDDKPTKDIDVARAAENATGLKNLLDEVGKDRVWDEFTDPSDLRQKILKALAEMGVRFVPQLPETKIDYIGRVDKLEELRATLVAGKTAALTGMGGIGKTQTAAHIAHQLKDVFPGGILWKSLDADPKKKENVFNETMQEWASYHYPGCLKTPEELKRDPGVVRKFLSEAPGRLLIVLDNIWYVDTAQLLLQLIPDNATLLLTSRRADILRTLQLLERPTSIIHLDRLSDDESYQLMVKSIGEMYDDSSLREIIRIINGHPLSLANIVAQIIDNSHDPNYVDNLPTRLIERRTAGGLLDLWAAGASTEGATRSEISEEDRRLYESMSLVFTISYEHLPEKLQYCFRSLGVTAHDASLPSDLVSALWSKDTALETQDAVTRMRKLVSAGLASGNEDDFRQHGLIRDYAHAILVRNSELEGFENVYANYITFQVTPRFITSSPDVWNSVLQPFFPHIHYVGDYLFNHLGTSPSSENGFKRALAFSSNTVSYLANHRELNFNLWLEMGRTASKQLAEPTQEIFFLNEIGDALYSARAFQEAAKRWYEALQLARSINDQLGEANALLNIGKYLLVDDAFEATKFLRPALQLFETLKAAGGQLRTHLLLADVHSDPYNSSVERGWAIEHLEKALPLALAANDTLNTANIHLRLGKIRNWMGSFELAQELLESALLGYEKLGQRDGEAVALLNLANARANIGDFGAAARYLENAFAAFKFISDHSGLAAVLLNQGELFSYQNRHEEAATAYAETVPLIGDRGFEDDVVETETIVNQFFEAQLDRIVKERFGQVDPLQATYERPIHRLVIKYLLQQTLAAKSSGTISSARWLNCLQIFLNHLQKHLPKFQMAFEFVGNLANIIRELPIKSTEDSPYSDYLQRIGLRISSSKHTPLISTEMLETFRINTIAVLANEREHLKDWRKELREMRAEFSFWNDKDETELLESLLNMLDNTLYAVHPSNAYFDFFNSVIEALSEYQVIPLNYVVENIVAVKTINPDGQDEWKAYLEASLQKSQERQLPHDEAFLEALLKILRGESASLSDDNPYAKHVLQIQDAIQAGKPIFRHLPNAVAASLLSNSFRVITQSPKEVDVWLVGLRHEYTSALKQKRTDDAEFLKALMNIIENQPMRVPTHNPYYPGLLRLAEAITKEPKTVDVAACLMPDEQISSLVGQTLSAKTLSENLLAETQNFLKDMRDAAQKRGSDWRYESEFLTALIAITEDQPFELESANPYFKYPYEIADKVERYWNSVDTTTTIPHGAVEKFIQKSFSAAQLLFDLGKINPEAPQTFKDILDNMTTHYDLLVDYNKWRDAVHRYREESVAKGALYDGQFFDALLALLDQERVSLPNDNPYQRQLMRALRDLGYQPSVMQQRKLMYIESKVLPPQEFIRKYTNIMVDELDSTNRENVENWSENAVAVMTYNPDLREEFREFLSKYPTVGGLGAFAQAIVALLDDKPAELPEQHPYRQALDDIKARINSYRSTDTLVKNTIAVMTFAGDRKTEWREVIAKEIQALKSDPDAPVNSAYPSFFEALLAILDGKEPDLPKDHPFRPQLQRVIEGIKSYEEDRQNREQDELDWLINNTIAVCTSAPEKLAEWQTGLTNYHAACLDQNAPQFHIELVEALLAILNDKTPTVPEDNPYRKLIAFVAEKASRGGSDQDSTS